ncbi:DUF4352 domain-containing protein [Acrocarpospora sp. B8E8]|uniref:DUF4352 domain-containing protein n=1 Tax=Acrocarpospora sp. B8E8 TaxID=3153572 RepID=UPI00325F04AD
MPTVLGASQIQEEPMAISRITAFVIAALLLTGCGAASVTSSADKPADSTQTVAPAAGEKPAEPAKPAGVGDIITLAGSDEALKMAIKVSKVIKAGESANEMFAAKSGNRLYGIQLTLKNVGTDVYDDAPGNGAKVIDAEGQEYDASLFGEIANAQNIGSTTISVGDVRKGFVVFEVPAKAKIVKFQLALNSGFAGHHGEWLLS